MIIKNIAHLADIHIRSEITRHPEYREVFAKTYTQLQSKSVDRIVVVGDLFDNYTTISNEAKILGQEFLSKLSEIAKTIVIAGNHDLNLKNLKRVNSIKAATEHLNNPRVVYYDKSGFYEDENIVWVVWAWGERINPWKDIPHIRKSDKKYVDLFHDPINGSTTGTGKTFDSKKYKNLTDFNGDLLLAGDIHTRLFFNK